MTDAIRMLGSRLQYSDDLVFWYLDKNYDQCTRPQDMQAMFESHSGTNLFAQVLLQQIEVGVCFALHPQGSILFFENFNELNRHGVKAKTQDVTRELFMIIAVCIHGENDICTINWTQS